MSIRLAELPLEALQPSQFLVSQAKLVNVLRWFSPKHPEQVPPVPVKLLDGVPVMTDGHTRAVAALQAGLRCLPLVWEQEDLDWEMYRRCVAACRARGVLSPADLSGRVVTAEEYAAEWDRWCDEMQARVLLERSETRGKARL